MSKRRVGIVGFGSLGVFLKSTIDDSNDFEVAFVWNRSVEKISDLPESIQLKNLSDFRKFKPDIIVEVAHPNITKDFGASFLTVADYMIGSPTALADEETRKNLHNASNQSGHSVYVPSGAFWGGGDIRKMADLGTLKGLTVTMKKHPSSLKLESPLKEKNEAVIDSAVTLFEGPVKDLCPLAPNNVNTMAAAAVAGHSLGFEKVTGRLVADPSLTDSHIVEVEVQGVNGFKVHTVRTNPAKIGAVTGQATYNAFWSSLKGANGKGSGIHLC